MRMSFRTYKQSFLRRLMAAGESRADSTTATTLGWNILSLDTQVFGKPALNVHYSTGEENDIGLVAAYVYDRPEGEDEMYIVNVPHLARFIGARCQSKKDLPTPVSWACMLATIAAHEVRHRVQRLRPELKQFTANIKPEGDDLVRWAWRMCSSNWARMCRKIIASQLDPKIKQAQMSTQEFDAWVVETIVLNGLRGGLTREDIVRLISLDAPEPDRA